MTSQKDGAQQGPVPRMLGVFWHSLPWAGVGWLCKTVAHVALCVGLPGRHITNCSKKEGFPGVPPTRASGASPVLLETFTSSFVYIHQVGSPGGLARIFLCLFLEAAF